MKYTEIPSASASSAATPVRLAAESFPAHIARTGQAGSSASPFSRYDDG